MGQRADMEPASSQGRLRRPAPCSPWRWRCRPARACGFQLRGSGRRLGPAGELAQSMHLVTDNPNSELTRVSIDLQRQRRRPGCRARNRLPAAPGSGALQPAQPVRQRPGPGRGVRPADARRVRGPRQRGAWSCRARRRRSTSRWRTTRRTSWARPRRCASCAASCAANSPRRSCAASASSPPTPSRLTGVRVYPEKLARISNANAPPGLPHQRRRDRCWCRSARPGARRGARGGCSERHVLDAGERGFRWQDLLDDASSLSLFAEQRLLELRIPNGKPGTEGSKALRVPRAAATAMCC
jgi:hypothetical protein